MGTVDLHCFVKRSIQQHSHAGSKGTSSIDPNRHAFFPGQLPVVYVGHPTDSVFENGMVQCLGGIATDQPPV
jgi:hypothetical protein